MAIKLYGMPGFTSMDRCVVTLYEKGVTDFEVVKVSVMDGDHRKPEFLKKQPFGIIPVLEMGKLTLFESRAISRVICSVYEGKATPLYGSSGDDRAMTQVWLEAEAQNYHPPIYKIVNEVAINPLYGKPTNEAVVASELEKLVKILDIYEARLGESKYLAGDFFSLADLSHLPHTHYLLNVCKMDHVLDGRPHVKAWWNDISARPAWKKTQELAASYSK